VLRGRTVDTILGEGVGTFSDGTVEGNPVVVGCGVGRVLSCTLGPILGEAIGVPVTVGSVPSSVEGKRLELELEVGAKVDWSLGAVVGT